MRRHLTACAAVLAVGICLAGARDLRAQIGSGANATLRGRFTPPTVSRFTDVWGYVSPTGREYAILGTSTGVYIVDCTNPQVPIQRAFIADTSSPWTDIKTYGHYAYVGNNSRAGLRVIDLSDPDNPVDLGVQGQTLFAFSHNIAIDTGTGKLYACSTDVGMPVLNLGVNPVLPTLETTYTAPASTTVHNCHVQDGFAYLAEFSEVSPQNQRLRIVGVDALPALFARGSVAVAASHNVWATRDNQYAVTSSEVVNGKLTVFDIRDKDNPVQIAEWGTAPGTAIHDAYVYDRIAHASWFAAGYQAVDLSDPQNPVHVASMDTSTTAVGLGTGAWGVYPFQPSGTIYISDYRNGLFLVSAASAPARFGRGTARSSAVPPTIHTFGAGYKGNRSFKLIAEGVAANSPALLLVGIAQRATSALGVELLVDLAQPHLAVAVLADAQGHATIPVPLAARLPSVTLHAQFLLAEPAGFSATRGISFDIFDRL